MKNMRNIWSNLGLFTGYHHLPQVRASAWKTFLLGAVAGAMIIAVIIAMIVALLYHCPS